MPTDLTCPHCAKSAPHDVVPQATFTERLSAIGAQRDGFKAEADKHRAEATKIAADAKDWQAAAQELGAMKAKAEEDGALAAAGLRADAAPHHRSYLKSLYDAAPKPADAEKPPLADWLKAQATAADADPLLLALRATPGSPGTPANPAIPQTTITPARAPVVLPPTPNTAPPVPGGNPQAALHAQMAADAAAGRPWTLEATEKALAPFKT